jgi:hypothetical protein
MRIAFLLLSHRTEFGLDAAGRFQWRELLPHSAAVGP